MEKLHIYLLLLLGLLVSSCNDWLDVKPRTQVRNDEMYDSYKGFKDALTACYIKMNDRKLYGQQMNISAVEFLAQHWEIDYPNSMVAEVALKDFDYKDDQAKTVIKNIYGGLYNVIVQANAVLQNIRDNGQVITDDATRAVIEGEAYAIRAFCHFDVLRLFGQIPKNATIQVALPYAETVSIKAVAYYSYTDFITKIEDDLTKAETLLKDNDPIFKYTFNQLNRFESSDANKITLEDAYMGYRQFRFNYYAVKALEARFFMYIGETAKAYAAAKAVIDAKNADGTKVLTLAGTEDYNKGNFALPSECVLALNNFELEDYVNDLFAVDKLNNFTVLYMNVSKIADLFSGQQTSANNRYNFAWDMSKTDLSGVNKPVLHKYYQDPDASYSSVDLATQKQVVPLIRLSEMYLIAMETTTSLAEANTMYIDYMQARNIPAEGFKSQEDLRVEIVNEYRREFFGEGQMFFTYKRMGATTMLWRNEDVSEENYIVALPDTEYNPNL